jgi:hypothetical protein
VHKHTVEAVALKFKLPGVLACYELEVNVDHDIGPILVEAVQNYLTVT